MNVANYAVKVMLVVLILIVLVLVLLLALREDGEMSSKVWIDAPPVTVWSVLAATSEYLSWNPFITKVSGDFVEEQTVQIQFGQADGGSLALSARVLSVRARRRTALEGQHLHARPVSG